MRRVPLLFFVVAVAACASVDRPRFRGVPLRQGELLSRQVYDDYEAATFSFEHGVRDDPFNRITHNDWDLLYGNDAGMLDVAMVVDDRSRLVDLGGYTWAELEDLPIEIPEPHSVPTREPSLRALTGHVYLVRTVDSNSDLVALFRVESTQGSALAFTWVLLDP